MFYQAEPHVKEKKDFVKDKMPLLRDNMLRRKLTIPN